MAGLFENQNNKNSIIMQYHIVIKKMIGLYERVENSFKNFHHVTNKSNEQIAELINNLEIDIAVDLKGYTYGTRIDILPIVRHQFKSVILVTQVQQELVL